MDNFTIDVTWEGEKTFRTILELVMKQKSAKVTHYAVAPDYGMILFWTEPGRGAKDIAQKMPYAMDTAAAIDFVWNWLKTADYGDQPDHDGSNGRGWRIFNEAWGHVKDEWAAICAIQPAWAMYGK